jgi:hypothetical protein
VNTLVNESRYLEPLAHGVEFVGGTHVAQERGDHGWFAQSRERLDQFFEAGDRFRFGVGGDYLA